MRGSPDIEVVHLTNAEKPFDAWERRPGQGMTKLGLQPTLGDGFYGFVPPLPRLWTLDTKRRKMRVRLEGEVLDLAKMVPAKDKVASVRLHTNRSNEGLVWKWAQKKHLKALLWEDGLGLRHVVPDGWATIFWQGNVTLLARPVEEGSPARWVPVPRVPGYARRGLHRSEEAARAEQAGLRPRGRLVQELRKAGVRNALDLVSHLHPVGWYMTGLYGRHTAYYNPADLPENVYVRLVAWRAGR